MNSFEEVFNCIIDYCRDVGEVGDVAIKLWIKTLQPISLEGNRAILSVDYAIQRGVVLENYEDIL